MTKKSAVGGLLMIFSGFMLLIGGVFSIYLSSTWSTILEGYKYQIRAALNSLPLNLSSSGLEGLINLFMQDQRTANFSFTVVATSLLVLGIMCFIIAGLLLSKHYLLGGAFALCIGILTPVFSITGGIAFQKFSLLMARPTGVTSSGQLTFSSTPSVFSYALNGFVLSLPATVLSVISGILGLLSRSKEHIGQINVANTCVVKFRCLKCGQINEEDSRFCKRCGAPLVYTQVSPPPP